MDKDLLTLRALALLVPAVEAVFKTVQDEFNRGGDISPQLEEQVEATVHKLAGLVAEQVSQALMQVNPRKAAGMHIERTDPVMTALKACVDFIENVTDDDPDRQDKFFKCRELWRQAFKGD